MISYGCSKSCKAYKLNIGCNYSRCIYVSDKMAYIYDLMVLSLDNKMDKCNSAENDIHIVNLKRSINLILSIIDMDKKKAKKND